ncbi:hypothetical protein SBF1_8060003 [Candidatus Desulfosporosinus infrequens]|uniref:Uncharacterized protein n=1 Tax=Candidatus Desulfosporosinus infrequens TaxID=2043169 RepID=A0A2U3LTN6_9FIRM|nr:hypothetical protein SBF1_8060003 [Candidatus Desulfosporosinus infrequens]
MDVIGNSMIGNVAQSRYEMLLRTSKTEYDKVLTKYCGGAYFFRGTRFP